MGTLIWVVDDDEAVRRSIGRLLRAAGYRVEVFASAEAFLARKGRTACGCLILDVRMPGTSGLDLQEALQASGSSLPLIFITAHDDSDAERHALRNGAVAFLRKPFEDRALLDAIGAAPSGRES